jgi:hypothetical protein
VVETVVRLGIRFGRWVIASVGLAGDVKRREWRYVGWFVCDVAGLMHLFLIWLVFVVLMGCA